MSEKPSLFAELRRRNVIRMAGLYLVGAWLIVQVAGTVLPMFGAPEWLSRTIVILLAIGFLPAVVLSWVFELTPQGLKRDEDVRPEESIAPQTGRRMDRMIIVVLVLALGYFAFDKFALTPRREAALVSSAVPNESKSVINAKSIAVLPFENLSEEKQNEYFADGVQDEILTRLSKIADLKVISRTSTQHYKSAPENLPEIAKQLGVAHILEGRVQKSGEAVRVNVQLIKAANDSHLWAETFDRKLTDIFAVESEVAKTIADKLEAKLTGNEQRAVAQRPTGNLEAYDAYLRGLATHFIIWDLGRLQDAERHFRRAVELDPGFGLAWARLANVHCNFYFADFDATRERREAARTAAEMALKLASETGEAYLALGLYRLRCEHDFDLAAEAFEIARQRLPNNAEPLLELGAIAGQTGRFDEALALQRAALTMDPRNPSTIRRNGVFEAYFRHVSEAHAYIDRVLEITPDDSALIALKVDIYQSEGKLAEAERMLARLPPHLAPEKVTETCSRMRQLIYQHRYDVVISSLEPIVAAPPSSIGTRVIEYHILLAAAQQLAGNLAAARDTYEKGRLFISSDREHRGNAGTRACDVGTNVCWPGAEGFGTKRRPCGNRAGRG